MRSVAVYFFIITFILSFGFIERFDNPNEVNQIEDLLNKRISIINDFLYGEKDLEKLEWLKNQLSKIEAEMLLQADMNILTHIYNNPTDYERTTEVKINEVKKIDVTKDSIEMLANLQWTILASNELPIETSFTKDYNISCIIKDKKIYLTNMKFVE